MGAEEFTQVVEVKATKAEPGGVDSDEDSAVRVQVEVIDARAAPRSANDGEHGATIIAAVQGAAGEKVNGQKRRRKSKAGHAMTGDQARAQAEREGLAFVKSTHNRTGYYGVSHDPRPGLAFPYAVYVYDLGKESNWAGRFIGSYSGAEEAALAYARATNNTIERTINPFKSPNTLAALKDAHKRTLECKRCGLFVDWRLAKTFAKKKKRTELHAGDGCTGARCGARNATRLESARSQVKYAKQLLCGERELFEWPKNVEDSEAIPRPVEVARELATHLLARDGRPASRD